MAWKSYLAEPPPRGTFFVLIYSDGSGAHLFGSGIYDEDGKVGIADVEEYRMVDDDDPVFNGAVWTEAPQQLIERYFYRDD